MLEITTTRETGYTLLHVTQDCGRHLAAHRPAGAVRAGQRDGPARRVDRHDRRRACCPSPNGRSPPARRLPRRHRLPAAAEHGEGPGAHRRLQGREPGPLNLALADHAGRDEPHHRPVPASSGARRPASTTSRSTRSTRASYILTALLGQLPGVPVAQPRRLRPRQPVHLVALVDALPVGRARAELRAHQGPRDRRGARRQPGRDRPGQEAGVRRDDQQAVRRAVLQPLGLLDDLGRRPQARRHGVENFTLPDGTPAQLGAGHRRHVQPETLWVEQ